MFYNDIIHPTKGDDVMENLDKVIQTPLDVVQAKLGMSLADMADIVKRTGLAKHSDIRWMLQREYGIDHEDARMLVNALLESQVQSVA
ncbi:MAG TPA: hypothetical protein PLF42_06695 [Anaerolineales bacterium]|nr:hypothetical protein [Anaerolineales bacterium]